MKKKLFMKLQAGLLAASLVIGQIPALSMTANAEGTMPETRSMNLNIRQVDGSYRIAGITDPAVPVKDTDPWSGTKVYYGKYKDVPLLFRVLDADTTDYNSAHTMFLDCDTTLEKVFFDDDYRANEGAARPNEWAYSDIREWMNSNCTDVLFHNNYINFPGALSGFTTAEQKNIAASTRTSMTVDGLGDRISSELSWCTLSNEKVFALDVREASNPAYGYSAGDDAAENRKNQDREEISGGCVRIMVQDTQASCIQRVSATMRM